MYAKQLNIDVTANTEVSWIFLTFGDGTARTQTAVMHSKLNAAEPETLQLENLK